MSVLRDLASSAWARIGDAFGLGQVAKQVTTQAPTEQVAIPAPWVEKNPAMLGNSITPQLVTQIIFERNSGYLQRWVDLADEAREKDPHLHSQLSIREQSVVETEWEVLPGEGSNQQSARRNADAFRERLKEWQTRSVAITSDDASTGWDTWIAELTGAVYYPAACHEVIWERDGREIVPVALEQVSPRRLSYASDIRDADPWALRLWDADDLTSPFSMNYGVKFSEFHPDKFLLQRTKVRNSQPTREGLFAVLVWYWIFGSWAWRDVMNAIEMLGRPPVIAYYSAGGAKAEGDVKKLNGERYASKEEKEQAYKAVTAISGSLRALLADTTKLVPLDLKWPGGITPPQILVQKAVQELTSKAINGVANLSDLQKAAGASVESQERLSNTFYRSDCRRVARVINYLGSRYIKANPGALNPSAPMPVFRFKCDPPADLKQLRENLQVARGIGLKVKKSQAYKLLQIEEPTDGDEVLEELQTPVTQTPTTQPNSSTSSDPQTTPELPENTQ